MKRVFFGLLVAGVALSASAFTNAKSVELGDIYVERTPGIYTKLGPTEVYVEGLCEDNSELPCSFQQTNNVDYADQLDYSTISSLPFTPSATEGIYND